MHQLQLIFVLSTFYSFLFLFLVVGGIEIVYYNINNEVTRPQGERPSRRSQHTLNHPIYYQQPKGTIVAVEDN